MPDTMILRFRDIAGADTIEEHRRIITSAGYAWWGWWKKEIEPNRNIDLEQLHARARNGENIVAGLFDRATDRYYCAALVDCIFQSNSAIRSPEPAATPSYYSEQQVAAWFKLVSIEEIGRNTFVELFTDVPVGEGTFFPVWQKGSQPMRGATNLYRTVIPMGNGTIVHLSDLHFGADFAFPRLRAPGRAPLADILARDLQQQNGRRCGVADYFG